MKQRKIGFRFCLLFAKCVKSTLNLCSLRKVITNSRMVPFYNNNSLLILVYDCNIYTLPTSMFPIVYTTLEHGQVQTLVLAPMHKKVLLLVSEQEPFWKKNPVYSVHTNTQNKAIYINS